MEGFCPWTTLTLVEPCTRVGVTFLLVTGQNSQNSTKLSSQSDPPRGWGGTTVSNAGRVGLRRREHGSPAPPHRGQGTGLGDPHPGVPGTQNQGCEKKTGVGGGGEVWQDPAPPLGVGGGGYEP